MRVGRDGDEWAHSYSYDGLDWSDPLTFTHELTVTAVGVYGANFANEGQTPPAHTALVDYFFNTASPIVPEDGDRNRLTVNTVGEGTVDVDPEKTNYECEDLVTLTADADPGWTFTGWSGDVTSTENPLTLEMTGDTSVTATFTEDEYTLTVNKVGNGTVDVDPEKTVYKYRDEVTLTADADLGWTFAGWSGDATGMENPLTFEMTDDTSITATFTEDKYTLTVNKVGEGTVDVDPEQAVYNYGDVVTLTADADLGWTFTGWSGDVGSVENPLTFEMEGDTTVVATFTSDAGYTLTVNIVGKGRVVVDPEKTLYPYGDVVTLTATARPSWLFGGWSGDVISADNPETVEITDDTVIDANFKTYPVYLPFVARPMSR
jgi:uncharacterized repeat protein (TIGR02543 family)